MDHRAITCRELTELATAYLEPDGLDQLTRELTEEHLVFCDPCRHYLAQLRDTGRSLAHHRDEGPSAPLMDALLASFRRLP